MHFRNINIFLQVKVFLLFSKTIELSFNYFVKFKMVIFLEHASGPERTHPPYNKQIFISICFKTLGTFDEF